MQSFMSQAHSTNHVAHAKKDSMAGKLAKIKAHSLTAKGDLVSLRSQVDSLWEELASSIADANHYR